MRTISSKDYTLHVGDEIEWALEDALYDALTTISHRYGFDTVEHKAEFNDAFVDGYAATMRDLAIELFEELGMDVRPDGKEW